jgi:hypothetical protein
VTALSPTDRSDAFVEDMDKRIEFRANPVQKAFITSRAKADLFAARMGEGKSAALCWACFYHTQQNPGARWAMVRDTWENLRDTTQLEFFEWFPKGVCGEYVGINKTWQWSIGEMRGSVQWMGMDDEKDAAKLQSRALAAFGMDEPAPAAHSGGIAEYIFTTAMSRLRQRGINWYTAKLAVNNPDEAHWTYRRFADPRKKNAGYRCWQTGEPENLQNLPEDYYTDLRDTYKDRPDLLDRFVDGKFGFQRIGRSVTPAWNDSVHLVPHLQPAPGELLHLLWDFGLNPTCIVTDLHQGHWRILEALVGHEVGAIEHIEQSVKPLLTSRYEGFEWDHTHDPANPRDQSSSEWTPVRVIREELGGPCYPGAIDFQSGADALNATLAQLRDGRGLVEVDKSRAQAVWWALRGGWHYPVQHSGVTSSHPKKDEHSHPGDAMRYGASRFFPMGRLRGKKSARASKRGPRYFKSARPGQIPKEAQEIKDPKDAKE